MYILYIYSLAYIHIHICIFFHEKGAPKTRNVPYMSKGKVQFIRAKKKQKTNMKS